MMPWALVDLAGGQAENHDIFIADPIWISRLAPSNLPIVMRRSVRTSYYRCRRLPCRPWNLLRKIGGGDDLLRQADIVVGNKHHLQLIIHRWIVIDPVCHVISA